MNRRGTLEWNLETIGKLALYLVMFFFVIWATMKIVDLFRGGEHEARAKTNLEYLKNRIDAALAGDTGPEASVIIQVPTDYGIIAFDKSTDKLQFSNNDKLVFTQWPPERIVVERPNDCKSKESCLCVGKMYVEIRSDKLDYLTFEPSRCESFETDFIVGLHPKYELHHPGLNDITLGVPSSKVSYGGKQTYAYAHTTYENFHPMNLHVVVQDGGIVLIDS